MLIAAAILAALLGEWVDTIVIALVVIIDAIVGFIQEGKSEAALEGIRDMLQAEADVLRDGRWQVIDAEELVPGDVVRLHAGDKVPADMRLLQANNVSVE